MDSLAETIKPEVKLRIYDIQFCGFFPKIIFMEY